jgi:IPT/TIG domain
LSKVSDRLLRQGFPSLLAVAVVLAIFQPRADAADVDLQFKELMAGANGNSRIQFLIIQQQRGQNLWGPQAGETQSRAMLVFYNAAGRETGIFKFPKDPATGGVLQTLIATQEFASLPGAPVPDVTIPPLLIPIAGKVCFKNNPANPSAAFQNECVSYGNFRGDTEANRRSTSGSRVAVQAGPPADSLPILNVVSLRRTTDSGRNSDFRLSAAAGPMNIAGASVAIPLASVVDQGATLFNNETFLGNGRTCATCHVPGDNLRLSPGNIQSRFATLASPTFSFDPLFIGEFKPSFFDAGFDFNLNTLVLAAPVATPSPCTGQLNGVIRTSNGGTGKVLARIDGITYLVYGGMNPKFKSTGTVTDGTCSGTVASITAGNLAGPPSSSIVEVGPVGGSVTAVTIDNPTGIEDPRFMRISGNQEFPQGRGLILENIDGFSNPPVFRKSPHLLNLDRTAPYGLNGNIPDLKTFITGAVTQHFPRTLARNAGGPNPDFRLPTADESAAIEAFLGAQEFPAGNDPNKFDLDRFATTFLQRVGRTEFFGTPSQPNCSICHGGPVLAQTTMSIQGKPAGVNASFNTGAIGADGDILPCELGSPTTAACNSREFSVPSLFNANSLGPFFHNGNSASLAEAVEFYGNGFTSSPASNALSAQGLSINACCFIDRFLAGLTPRPYTLTQGPIRFGVQATSSGPTASQSISITNTGSSAITFSSPACTLTGSDAGVFVIASCPLTSSLPAGQTATVLVAFDPTSAGLKSATLEINAAVPSGIDLFGVGDTALPPPTLTGIVGNSGTADGGDAVTLTGTNFISGATVTIGGVRTGFVKLIDATSITARTGAHASGFTDVVVTNPDGQSATMTNGFNYTPSSPLSLAMIAPASGPSLGAPITITGTGFHDRATVMVGGVSAANVNVQTSTAIAATTGAHAAGPVDLCIINLDGGQACLSNAYTYVSDSPPTVSSAAPGSGPYLGGDTVTIQGSGFATGTTVRFGGTPALILKMTATSISVRTEHHASGVVDIVVTNGDGQTTTLPAGYSYLPPSIRSVSPASGTTAGGTSVSISGGLFDVGYSVTFGGVSATSSIVDGTQIFAVAAPHPAGVVDVVVTNPDGISATLGNGFTYVAAPPPQVTAVAPPSGSSLGGTSLTISGSAFAPGATVKVGGVSASTVSFVNSGMLTAITGPHAGGLVDVTVRNADGQTSTLSNAFTYTAAAPPAVSSIFPYSGSTLGGTAVTITGTGFSNGATVTIGGQPPTNVTVVNPTTVVAATVAGPMGTADVAVTNPDSQNASLANAFTYVSTPTNDNFADRFAISGAGLIVASGSNAGATSEPEEPSDLLDAGSGTPSVWWTWRATCSFTVASPNSFIDTIGSSFDTRLGVFTGSSLSSLVLFASDDDSGGNLSSRVPNDQLGPLSITAGTVFQIRVRGFSGDSLGTIVLHINSPCGITGVVPSSAPDSGGTSVTVIGTGFTSGATVNLGGVNATGVNVVSSSTITATTEAHAADTVDVTVTATGQTPATLPNGFTYTGVKKRTRGQLISQ